MHISSFLFAQFRLINKRPLLTYHLSSAKPMTVIDLSQTSQAAQTYNLSNREAYINIIEVGLAY